MSRQVVTPDTMSQEGGPNPWLILISVALGLFMVVVNISILNIALPTIAGDMRASLAEVQWTLISYTLVLTGLVPVFGRVSDVFGRKRLFIIGLLIFTAGGLAAALSPSIIWLIILRGVQAVGGAMITSNVLAIITDTFPAGKRGAAMGVQTIIISGGAAVAPTLGGFLVTNFGWEAVFLLNGPIGLVALTLGAVILPSLQPNRTLEPIDVPGAVLIMGGLGTLLLGLTKGPAWGWSSPVTLTLIGAGLVGLGLFVMQERRVRHPLVDLSLFKIREFAAGQVAGTFATVALASMMLLLPFYWQGLRGYEAQTAGFLMLPIPLTLMVTAPIAGRLSDRVSAQWLATAGLVVIMAGLFLVSQITATMPVWEVVGRLLLLGIGLGMFMAPNNNAVMSAAPAARRGIASGLLGMFRYIGQASGVAISGTVFATFAISASGFALDGLPSPGQMAQLAGDPAARTAFQDAFIAGMRASVLAAIPLAGIGAVLSLMRSKLTPAESSSSTTSTIHTSQDTPVGQRISGEPEP